MMKNLFPGIPDTENKKFSYLFSMAVAFRLLFFAILHLSIISTALVQAKAAQDFIYNGFQDANLHLDGIAEIHSNGLLQLTNTSKQQTGHAFYQFPLKFDANSSIEAESLSFSTIFVFAMVPELQNLSGHGMAFVISPSMDFSHATASQYLGLFNTSNNGLSTNHIVAVEFDTILSPDLKDTDANHVGIDVNGLISNASASATYFSNKERKNRSLELICGDPIQVWIDYDEAKKLLNVTLAPLSSPKPEQLLLSTRIDLSQVLLDSMYVGFSAATGTLASDHYILGWSYNKTGKAQNLDVTKLPSLPPHKKEDKKQVLTIALLTAVVVVLITVAIVTYIIRKKKYEEVREDWEREYGTHRFSYMNLYRATNGFKDKELLGAGGFGKVYRGVLPSSNVQIAVKRVSHNSRQGMKEFVAEIVSLGRLRHRNLVQLLGYCRRQGELLLVYDYMPKGSLDKILCANDKPVLSWSRRFGIIRGVASGLLYLHEEWEQLVLHRDIKASNVLLDSDWNGRLGDFGLARLYDHGTNPQTTHVVGTVGYLAPELARFGKATTSTDVFSFGAFMLEVACGRKPVELHRPPDEIVLVDWVIACLKRGAILEASDHKLEGNYVTDEMELVLKLGLFCSHSVPEVRPNMRQVMQYLDGDAYLPEIPIDTAGINIFAPSNEASDLVMSFPSTVGTGSINSLSSDDSILTTGNKNVGLKIGLAASFAGIVLISVYFGRKFFLNNSIFCRNKKGSDHEMIEAALRNQGSLAPRRYRYSEVKRITKSFREKLGNGGYGSVFKGKLPDGRLVAVKVLKDSKSNGEDFVNEVASISRTSHVNIVILLGFCFEGSKRALIYEFMPNGSLEKYIYEESTQQGDRKLGWQTLYQIAVGIGQGLEYLHRGCNTRILHFDIKPHNILLDKNFCPKISDFGLSKICTNTDSVVSMLGARGTLGYIAPEVFSRNIGGVSHKSDVYSYGMMVLEMVGGRKNVCVEVDHSSEIYFPHWIYNRIELGKELGLLGITSDEENQIARKMILVGLWCIQIDPSNRPPMCRVVEMLQGSPESLPAPPKPYSSSPSSLPTAFADSSSSALIAFAG